MFVAVLLTTLETCSCPICKVTLPPFNFKSKVPSVSFQTTLPEVVGILVGVLSNSKLPN